MADHVLRVTYMGDSWPSRDYYTGASYIHQGQRYAICGHRSSAKVYKSQITASSAAKRLSNFENIYRFEVEPL